MGLGGFGRVSTNVELYWTSYKTNKTRFRIKQGITKNIYLVILNLIWNLSFARSLMSEL